MDEKQDEGEKATRNWKESTASTPECSCMWARLIFHVHELYNDEWLIFLHKVLI